jgi:D-amino peptidase
VGDGTTSIHPDLAVEQIEEAARGALSGDLATCRIAQPKRFVVEVRYRQAQWAYKASFYPGCRLLDAHTVRFETDDFGEVLRMKLFT